MSETYTAADIGAERRGGGRPVWLREGGGAGEALPTRFGSLSSAWS